MDQANNINSSKTLLLTIFHAYRKIGTCSCAIADNQRADQSVSPIFPASWFSKRSPHKMLPFLQIDRLEPLEQRKAGSSRLCLQALFELSQKHGCMGRMVVNTNTGTDVFCEKCGFKRVNNNQENTQYFDPSDENLSLLYGGLEQKGDFKFIPFSVSKTVQEKNSIANRKLFKSIQEEKQRIK